MKKKRNWFGLMDMFIGIIVFISLFAIAVKYGITTAFFTFENYNGTWEMLINIGVFWVIGMVCIDKFFEGLNKIRGIE